MVRRLALFASGSGSTALRLYEETRTGELKDLYTVACLVVSNAQAGAIEKLRDAGMPEHDIHIVTPSKGPVFADNLLRVCGESGVDVIHQCGWMPRTPLRVVQAYEGRMINQHPASLHPGHRDFGGQGMYGVRAVAACLAFGRLVQRPGAQEIEATAQFVHEEFDRGDVIAVSPIPFHTDDTPEKLHARMRLFEHETQIRALVRLALGEAQPLIRDVPLVLPEEVAEYDLAKSMVDIFYPRG